MAMRRWLMPAIFPLCLVFFLASWTGTAGLGVALAYEQPQKGVPKPQPIPHRHERECEDLAQKEPAAPRIADCLDYRAECHCTRPCYARGTDAARTAGRNWRATQTAMSRAVGLMATMAARSTPHLHTG